MLVCYLNLGGIGVYVYEGPVQIYLPPFLVEVTPLCLIFKNLASHIWDGRKITL